jgi:hypothetical protein
VPRRLTRRARGQMADFEEGGAGAGSDGEDADPLNADDPAAAIENEVRPLNPPPPLLPKRGGFVRGCPGSCLFVGDARRPLPRLFRHHLS